MKREHNGRIRIERLFLLLYIPFVLAMTLVMPLGAPPDEQAHLRQIWLLSTGQTGTENCVYPENLRNLLADSAGGTEASVLKEEDLRTARLSEATVTEPGNEATGIYPLAAYLPQSLVMFLTRLFTDKIRLLLYSARIGSMLVTGLLFYFAIRRSPAGKTVLLAIALLPLTLQEAASASCDGMVIAGISWITVELLRRIGTIGRRTPGDSLRFAGMGVLAVLCKLTYAPVLLLGLMPGAADGEAKKQKRRENLLMAAGFLAAAVLWYVLSIMRLSARQGMTGEAMNRLGRVLANPLTLIGMQVRTLIHQAPGWIRQLFGVFGRLDVFSPWILTALTGISFLAVAVTDSGIGSVLTKKRARGFRILMICIFILCWMLLSGALLVWWTPEDDPLIEGLQGRYFLPAMFGLLLCLPEVMKSNPERREIIRKVALGIFIASSAATVILLGIRL